jgi:hypothetical protein
MQLAPQTSLVGAAVLDPNQDALLISASGRTARATPDALAVVARDRRGSPGLKLEDTDTLARMVILPS